MFSRWSWMLACSALICSLAPAAEPSGPVAARMQQFVQDKTVSGAVALVARHGKIVSLDAAGLADIQAERPALNALYATLNPTQKQEFARTARHGMGDRMHMAMGMMRHAPQMGRRLGRGPDGAPPMPPPPPQ